MGDDPIDPKTVARQDAARMRAQMRKLEEEAVRTSARLAGLSAGKVTQTRARPSSVSGGLAGSASASGGLTGGGQAQRSGGIQGGKIGGPLGSRGPAGTTARE